MLMKIQRITLLILLLINASITQCIKELKKLVNMIKKHKIFAILIFTIFISVIGFITLHTKADAKFIISLISLAGVIFSYFYNKIMERRIALHSEAQWRPRLYNLMAKKKITYNDILYFTAFFNTHKDTSKNDIDIAIRNALEAILNDNDEFKLNTELEKLYSTSPSKNITPPGNLLDQINGKSLDEPLKDKHVILFKACISELLKSDWDKQK